jgi:hypothetical protein
MGGTPATGTPATASVPGWRLAHFDLPKQLSPLSAGLTLISPRDIWAMGKTKSGRELVEHWDGKNWQNTPIPQSFVNGVDSFGGVVGGTPGNLWARGWRTNNGEMNYALRWDGHRWTVQHTWYSGSPSFTPVGAKENWAFFTGNVPMFALHFDGHSWTKFSTPLQITAASVLSAKDIWAVGSRQLADGSDLPGVAHWDGRRWSLIPTPDIPTDDRFRDNVTINGILAKSDRDIWAVGTRPVTHTNTVTNHPVVLHWNGTKWSLSAPKIDTALYWISSDGQGGVWAAGDEWSVGHMLHFTGGAWREVSLPNVKGKSLVVGQPILVPHTTSLWAVGYEIWGGLPFEQPVMLQYGS